MFCRSSNWLICIFVAVAIATGYSGEDLNTGSDSEITVHQFNVESSTADPVQEPTGTDLGALLDAAEGATVILVAGNTSLLVHRAVLAARSPVFASIFHRMPLNTSTGEVSLSDVEGPVLRQLVAYLYTLRPPRLPGMAAQLLAAADLYGLSALKADCEQQLIANLSAETAVAAALLAVRHNCDSLRNAAVTYIRAHIFQVMATQGWADAIISQPEVMAKVTRLLSESPADASSPAPTNSGTPDYPATQPHSGPQTAATAAPTTAAQTTAQTDDDHVSLLRNLSSKEKGRRLIMAAKQGEAGELEALLAAGADVGARDEDGSMWTALHWAATEGREEAARRLLAAEAAVDARNSWQATPLHNAARFGHASVVRLLLAADADSGARAGGGWTPLHLAALGGHASVVRLMLAENADHSARNSEGWSPLHVAAAKGYAEVAAALLEGGADTAARTKDGETPLDLARVNNHQQVVELLQGR